MIIKNTSSIPMEVVTPVDVWDLPANEKGEVVCAFKEVKVDLKPDNQFFLSRKDVEVLNHALEIYNTDDEISEDLPICEPLLKEWKKFVGTEKDFKSGKSILIVFKE